MAIATPRGLLVAALCASGRPIYPSTAGRGPLSAVDLGLGQEE